MRIPKENKMWNDTLAKCELCRGQFFAAAAVMSYEENGREVALCPACMAGLYWHSPVVATNGKWYVENYAIRPTWLETNQNTLNYFRSLNTKIRSEILKDWPRQYWHMCNEYDCGDEWETCPVWSYTDEALRTAAERRNYDTWGPQ